MIELRSVSCSYGSKSILEDISLKIAHNMTILGANGSGKSTLAKALCNLVEYKGDIFFDTQNSQDMSVKQRAKNIAYIPAKLESYDTYMRVAEFVLLGRFPHKQSLFDYASKDMKIVQESLAFLHISHLHSRRVSTLSSGETQLVLIAQALAQQSKIIIFDEPTANLDPKNSQIIAKHIKSLQEHHQIILITHDLHLAHFVATPIVFVKEKKALVFEKDFFHDSTLKELYGVNFKALVAQYD